MLTRPGTDAARLPCRSPGERKGPLPLVVGVTGHRDLRPGARAPLEAAVRRILVELTGAHPATPLLVVSPLAEGADRLVARVALDLGARLVVPLPLPRALYETDFAAPGSRQEFADLLARADHWFELPLDPDPAAGDPARPGPARDRQYARVGAWIAHRSHVLLALWDGHGPGDLAGNGGTASIVRLRLEGPPPGEGGAVALDPPDRGAVYHILTPRARAPVPAGTPCSLVRRFPDEGWSHEASLEAHRRLLARIDAFNRDALVQPAGRARLPRASPDALWSDRTVPLPAPLGAVQEAFAVADALALHHQHATYRALRHIFVTVLAASACFAVFDDLWPPGWPLYLLSLALAGGARVRWLRARRQDVQNRYQDYRALAEGLRILFYWRLAGLGDSVATHYLRKQRGELEWIRLALEAWSHPAGLDAGPGPDPARLEAIARHWIGGQAAYFRAAARRDERRGRRLRTWAGRALRVWLALSGLLLVAVGVDMLSAKGAWLERLGVPPAATVRWSDHREPIRGALLVGLSLSLVVAALLHGYAEKRAFAEHARQYARMALLFAEAERQATALRDARRWDALRALIREVGREALIENGDWLLLHRERPLEVPDA